MLSLALVLGRLLARFLVPASQAPSSAAALMKCIGFEFLKIILAFWIKIKGLFLYSYLVKCFMILIFLCKLLYSYLVKCFTILIFLCKLCSEQYLSWGKKSFDYRNNLNYKNNLFVMSEGR